MQYPKSSPKRKLDEVTNKVWDKLCKGWEVNLKELEKIGKIEVPRQADD